jgi:hypothetical protein
VAALVMVDAGGEWSVVYAQCTDQCGRSASWSVLPMADASVGHVPTMALTGDGRPRIAYHVTTGSSAGLHYAQCDGECLSAASWHDVWLTDMPSVTPSPRPRLPFAVSASGGAAYAFDDATGLQLLLCTSGCASSAAWTRTQVAGRFIVPESLAYGPDEGLQLAARQRQGDTESLLFLECPATCASAQSWNGVIGLWQVSGGIEAQLEAQLVRTTSGDSRIVVYADDPATAATERVFGYLACDADCATPTGWQPRVLLPIAPDSANVGYVVVLDGADNPVLAHATDTTSAVWRCAAGCTTSAGGWEAGSVLTGEDLGAGFPITVPQSCEQAGWSMYTGPALTLVDGQPVSALTASANAYGGECEQGATLDTVSFVQFMRPTTLAP